MDAPLRMGTKATEPLNKEDAPDHQASATAAATKPNPDLGQD